MGIKCNVQLQVLSSSEFRIQLSQPKYAKVNQELQAEGTDDSRNWRNIYMPAYGDIPSDAAKHLGET